MIFDNILNGSGLRQKSPAAQNLQQHRQIMSKALGYIDFAAIKAAVSLEQILRHYGVLEALKPHGAGLRGCCPIHKGDDPKQFAVSLEKNAWNCFSQCKHGGNMLEFVMRMEGCTLSQAAWKVNEWFGLGMEAGGSERTRKASSGGNRTPAPVAQTHVPKPLTAKIAPATEAAPEAQQETGENEPNDAFAIANLDATHPYLAGRGLTPETIAHFGIGYCGKGIMSGRIAIPIHNTSGQIVGNAGRWPGEPPGGKEKYRLPGKFKKTLEVFNHHRAALEPDASPLVIVEGFWSVMHLWQLGLRRVVALMGSSMSERQEELVGKLTTLESRILLMLDNDEAGISARHKVGPRLAQNRYVRFFRWPEGLKQPDELAAEHVADLLA